MQQGIELNILDFTSEDIKNIQEGKEIRLENIKSRIKKFYNIDTISPEPGNMCRIISGGYEYISVESYSLVGRKIRNQLIKIKFN
jgi:hypothetical protein